MATSVQDVLSGSAPWAVEQADCLPWLAALDDGCIDLLFASPPYERARLYLENGEDMGIARDTEAWVAWMMEVSRAARHACRGLTAWVVEGQTRSYRYSCSPDLLRADLHRSGFHLRKSPIYHRVGIPGSGGPDWLRNDYEPVVCFTRGGKLPWSDNVATGEPCRCAPGGEMSHLMKNGQRVNGKMVYDLTGTDGYKNGRLLVKKGKYSPPEKANPGNVIHCAVGSGRLGHAMAHENEAPFPLDLAEFFVRSFCPPNGIVCDPFSGSGTTGAASIKWRRRFIGCDLRASQVELSRRRIGEETPMMFAE